MFGATGGFCASIVIVPTSIGSSTGILFGATGGFCASIVIVPTSIGSSTGTLFGATGGGATGKLPVVAESGIKLPIGVSTAILFGATGATGKLPVVGWLDCCTSCIILPIGVSTAILFGATGATGKLPVVAFVLFGVDGKLLVGVTTTSLGVFGGGVFASTTIFPTSVESVDGS